MQNFFEQIKHLFSPPKELSKAPILRESIERSAADLLAYEEWKLSDRKDALLHKLKMDYLNRDLDGAEKDLELVQFQGTNGFVYYVNEGMSLADEVQHLQDYMKDQVKSLGYIQQMGDCRSFVRKNFSEVIERYYLKPRPSWDEETMIFDQKFGNVTIERVLQDDKPTYVKLLCSYYVDHKFSEARNFGDLMRAIFEP